jgi:AbrB family looped-hinge helix DNA binding protein
MSTWIMSKLSSKGRITIPQRIRNRLGIQEGEAVLLQEVTEGVVILTRAPLSRPQIAQYLLHSLVTGIGSGAEKMGIREEEDLGPVTEAIRQRTFEERYGTITGKSGSPS